MLLEFDRSSPGGPDLECRVVTDIPVSELLERAALGERAAWDALVDRYSSLVWSVVRSFRIDNAAAADVTQTVWLRLVEHCGRIREAERLPGWLATTARNEALRVITKQQRQLPTEFEFDLPDSSAPSLEDRLVDDEVQRAALRAFARLPEPARQLMSLLCADPALDYSTISEIIGRPVGSIGPTRARIVERLRTMMAEELGEQRGFRA